MNYDAIAWAHHNSQNSGELVPWVPCRMEEKSSRYYCRDTEDDDTHSTQSEAPAGCYGTSVISSICKNIKHFLFSDNIMSPQVQFNTYRYGILTRDAMKMC